MRKSINMKLKAIYSFIKSKKTLFIIIICIILFILGLIRDIKIKCENNDNEIKIDNKEYSEKININIIGGVNRDYKGQIEKGLYLYKIIEEYCFGLTNKAIIDDINLVEIINKDYTLVILESDEIKNNQIYIEDYSQSKNKEYRYNGRIDEKIIIYIVDEGISEEDYKIITKGINDGEIIKKGLVNINTATLEELIEIGMGKSKSEKLIEYRKNNGKFETIEDIKKVSGIGDATFEKVKDKICAN